MILLDFSKAFDLVDHNILLMKMAIYGITDLSLTWFKSYFDNRTQRVKHKNAFSKPLKIESGVPQGSILGPLLFLIYINDLPLSLKHTSPYSFADDTTLLANSTNIRQLTSNINNELVETSQWANNNSMILTVKKTKSMTIYSKRKYGDNLTMEFQLQNKNIEAVKSAKLLGIHFDAYLQWEPHITYIHKIISSRLYLLKRIREYLPFETRKTFYSSLIYPHLIYCSTIWGNCSNALLLDLLKLQKRAARIICEVPTDTPSVSLFQHLKWLPIYSIIKMKKILVVFCALKEMAPAEISQLFQMKNGVNNNISTRSTKTDIKIARVETEKAKSKISYSGATLFNSLPTYLKEIDIYSYTTFKIKLRDFFLSMNDEVDHLEDLSCNDCKHIVRCKCNHNL